MSPKHHIVFGQSEHGDKAKFRENSQENEHYSIDSQLNWTDCRHKPVSLAHFSDNNLCSTIIRTSLPLYVDAGGSCEERLKAVDLLLKLIRAGINDIRRNAVNVPLPPALAIRSSSKLDDIFRLVATRRAQATYG